MRSLLTLFLVASLLAACDNNPFARNNPKENTRDKNDKVNRDDKDSRDKDDDDDGDEKDTKNNWTKKQRNELMDECIEESENHPQAKQICSCVLEKLEKKYSDPEDAKEAIENEDGLKLAKECGYKEDDENEYADNDDYKGDNNYDENDNSNLSWTSQQRKQYINGCATTAKQTMGFTAQEADSYCSCMTRKVEQKHSFKEAARMTATDFQTPEWQEAAADCLSR